MRTTGDVLLRWRGGAMALAMALLTPPAAAAQPAGAEPIVRWERLGSVATRSVRQFAASPGGPADSRLLLLVGSAATEAGPSRTTRSPVARSTDGGRTWQELNPLPFEVASLVLAPTLGQLQLAFATTANAVYRSADVGMSWQEVLRADGNGPLFHVALSPGLAQDGLVFATGVGRLWRSGDAGSTWEELTPADGQVVNQVVLSPDFAHDRTVWVAAASSPLPGPGRSWPRVEPAPSLGIVVSTDAGDSWQPAGDGLDLEDASFRQVHQLTPSPTFAADGVLFAFAAGPWGESRAPGYPIQRAALLRSQDRGASWDVVYETQAFQFHPHLTLSPSFAQDGLGVLALDQGFNSPDSGSCTVLRTGDGGQTWTTQLTPSTSESCGREAFTVALGGYPVFVVQKGSHEEWRLSTDGGLSWRFLHTPGRGLLNPDAGATAAPSSTGDGVVFGITSPQSGPSGVTAGEVWAYGAFGPCAQRPILGFGRVWDQDDAAREQLGCPRAPEHPVRVRERERPRNSATLPARDYWPEDDTPSWWRVYQDSVARPAAFSKAEQPWTDPPDGVVDGVIQPFDNGSMLFVPEPDGSERILTLAG